MTALGLDLSYMGVRTLWANDLGMFPDAALLGADADNQSQVNCMVPDYPTDHLFQTEQHGSAAFKPSINMLVRQRMTVSRLHGRRIDKLVSG
jgi:hypothetical protein